MQKQQRMLLIAVLVAAIAVSVSMALLTVTNEVHVDNTAASLLAGIPATHVASDGSTARTHYYEFRVAKAHSNRLISQACYRMCGNEHIVTSASRIAPEAILCHTNNGSLALIGRRAYFADPGKHLKISGNASTGTTLGEHSTRQLRHTVPTSTPTLAAVLDVPLTRGPTPII